MEKVCYENPRFDQENWIGAKKEARDYLGGVTHKYVNVAREFNIRDI